MEVEVDFRKTPQENANKYFEESKKARKKHLAAKRALERTLKQIQNLKIKPKEIKPREIKKKWFEVYRWMFTQKGFLIIGGKDAKQNEILFKKRLEKNDIVLHAEIPGAPLTIIKSQKKKIDLNTIKEAAILAACYSSAWKKGFGGIDVYWIKPDQVSKTPTPGEYLPKGSFMIRGKKNYLKKIPLKLTIGIKINDFAKPITGSKDYVKSKTKYFVTIASGRFSKDKLAGLIKKRFLKKVFDKDKKLIERISLEEIQRLIPAGKGSIV